MPGGLFLLKLVFLDFQNFLSAFCEAILGRVIFGSSSTQESNLEHRPGAFAASLLLKITIIDGLEYYLHIDDIYIYIHTIHIYTWNTYDPCFEWKRPSFGGFKPTRSRLQVYIDDMYIYVIYTLPETNIAPENGWFPIGISSSRGPFSGAVFVGYFVGNHCGQPKRGIIQR